MTAHTNSSNPEASQETENMKKDQVKAYVVVDEEGNMSWNDKTEKPENFVTFKTAEKRARELAEFAPGKPIKIYELMATAIVPVGKSVITFEPA